MHCCSLSNSNNLHEVLRYKNISLWQSVQSPSYRNVLFSFVLGCADSWAGGHCCQGLVGVSGLVWDRDLICSHAQIRFLSFTSLFEVWVWIDQLGFIFNCKKQVTFNRRCHSCNPALLSCNVPITVPTSDSTVTPSEKSGGGQLLGWINYTEVLL